MRQPARTQSSLTKTVPVFTWTRYGKWTEDGLYVLWGYPNGEVRCIYRHPLAKARWTQ